jgi:hypothetical protein
MNVVLNVVEKTFVCNGSMSNYARILTENAEIQKIQ